MTQDHAAQPKDPTEQEKTQASAPASPSNRLIALGHCLKRKIIKFVFDWLATAVVLLLLALVFEYVLPKPTGLVHFQKQLETSASNINPIALFDYVFESAGNLFSPIRDVFDQFFSVIGDLIKWMTSGIEHLVSQPVLRFVRFLLTIVLSPVILIVGIVMVFIAFLFFFVAVLLSPITLPLGIIMKGDVLEAILVLVVFLPSVGLVFRISTLGTLSELNLGERAALMWIGTMAALWVTTLFYFFVQLAMLGTALAIGKQIPEAPTVAAGSGIVAFCYHCTIKTVDDSVIGGLANALKKATKTMIRPG